jgi:hypothetical protein
MIVCFFYVFRYRWTPYTYITDTKLPVQQYELVFYNEVFCTDNQLNNENHIMLSFVIIVYEVGGEKILRCLWPCCQFRHNTSTV